MVYITYYLIIVLFFLKILINIYFFVYYKKITKNTNYKMVNISINKIINKFIYKYNISENIKIIESYNKKPILFFNYSTKKEEFVYSSALFNNSFSSIHEVDYILGRLWLSLLKIKNINKFNFYKKKLFYFPIIFNWLFNIFLLISFIILILSNYFPNYDLIVFLNKYNITFSLNLFLFLGYLMSIYISFLYKQKMEVEYSKFISNFIEEELSTYVNDFIVIRKFNLLIKFSFFPIKLINYKDYKILGTFVDMY